jgi:serine/threonine-protein kinase
MDTSLLTILITSIIALTAFLLIRYFKKTMTNRYSKLSYNERVALKTNLDLTLNEDNLSDRHIRVGRRERKNDFKGAIDDINVILQHETANVELVFKRGLNKFKISDFKGAIADFTEALKNNPADKYSYYYKGIANLKLSNFNKAFSDLTYAITLGINEKEVYFHRGLAEIEVEKYSEAIEDFNLYLGEHPNALEAYMSRGIAYNKCSNFDFALKDFNKAIDLNPNHEKAYFERAFVKKNLNDPVGYSNDLKTSYNKGYLHAYHFLKET